jgi:hypothetical protein
MEASKLNEDIQINSKNNITNIQITINTDILINRYHTPSIVHARPTWIDRDLEFIVVSNQTSIGGQGSSDLIFSASAGDVVRIYGTSEYNNMDNAVLIYRIAKHGGYDVFSPFISRKYGQQADSAQGLPPVFKQMGFWFYETSVQKAGTEKWYVSFALYIRVRGQVDPVLYGYFYWNPTVVVKD